MTFDDLIKHFDGQSYRFIGKKLGIAHSSLTSYKKNGIPAGRQAIIEIQTQRKLKADIPAVDEERTNNTTNP